MRRQANKGSRCHCFCEWGQAKSSGARMRQWLLSVGSEDSLVPIADDDVENATQNSAACCVWKRVG